MSPIRRILVAVNDLRPIVRPVVRKSVQIAAGCNARLELFHCLSNPLSLDLAADGPRSLRKLELDLRQEALQSLERIATMVRRANRKVTTAVEWDSPAYDAIIRRALKIKADLIVASVHSGLNLLPGVMRLTHWELVRHSPVPLLLIKSPRAYRNPAVLIAVDPSHAFSKPLRLDRELLQSGAALSRCLRGSVHAVHAYAPLVVGAVPAEAITERALKQARQRNKRTAQAQLERALTGSHIAHSRRYLVGRHPIDAILQAARRSRSAIVVMGAVSRSGFKRLLIGNTAESILDELRCDALIIKPPRFRCRVPRAIRGPRLLVPPPEPWPGGY